MPRQAANAPIVVHRVRLITTNAEAIEYTHAEDGEEYRHDFAAGVSIELLDDGSARIFRADGKSVWDDFDVDGAEDEDDEELDGNGDGDNFDPGEDDDDDDDD